jgi:hypothetical protein
VEDGHPNSQTKKKGNEQQQIEILLVKCGFVEMGLLYPRRVNI